MSSRPSPTVAHFAHSAVQGDALPPAPPPPGVRASHSQLGLDQITQPPALSALITTLGGAVTGYSPNPTSTTSLSSPFSQTHPSSGASARGVSNMAGRLSANYSAPYNPQEWGPVSDHGQSSSGQQLRIVNQVAGRPHPDGTLTSPPPPYSPRPRVDGSQVSSSSTASPAEPSFYTNSTQPEIPVASSSTLISTVVPSSGRYVRSRPTSMIQMGDSSGGRGQSFFAPPPPAQQTSHGPRALSKLGLDKFRSSSPRVSAFAGPNHGGIRDSSSIFSHNPIPDASDHTMPKPPAARRAMSADAVHSGSNSSRAESASTSRDSSKAPSWEPGMILPGPPPGPPPSASRSQSVGAADPGSVGHLLLPAQRPKTRQAPSLGTSLGPVPPTPADWADNALTPKPAPLHIDTSDQSTNKTIVRSAVSGAANDLSEPVLGAVSGPGLFRSAAQRDSLSKGLRERRAGSRSAVERALETPDGESTVSNNPWTVALENGTATHEGSHPRDNLRASTGIDEVKSSTASLSAYGQISADASSATPTASDVYTPNALRLNTEIACLEPTPPFSPASGPCSPTRETRVGSKRMNLQKIDASKYRPISHILHTPIEEMGVLEPLVPLQVGNHDTLDSNDPSMADLEKFISDSVARHREFLQKESVARDDQERLRVFSEYILAESRIRRRRYSKAWASGGFDVRPVKERLFEQTLWNTSRSSSISEGTTGLNSEPPTPASSASAHGRPESTWWSTYQPALSPIASMSNDEASSRGRTSSRWWESRTGSDSEGAARKLERSKRESKYMGFQRETVNTSTPEIDSSMPEVDEDDSYPEEKADPSRLGYYDDAQRNSIYQTGRLKQPESPLKLDISRFITLPPPYPRHHPAVNNSHPALVSYRTAVRAYSDLSEVTARKSRCNLSIEAMAKDTMHKLTEKRRRFRENVQVQIQEGSLTYAEAAEAEQALKLEEHEIEKQSVQAEYDSFQDVVLNPLHDMLNDRLTAISGCIQELQDILFSEARSINPDQTQEEGDEEPELLEKLTQLKWLFETREQVHKEVYDLLTQRNEKYKAIVLLPYQQAENHAKIANTKNFFNQDHQERQIVFYEESLKRHENFLAVIDSNVSRGIDMLSSTFWDIAPGILDLLQKIPEDLQNFEGIQIPEQEHQENPSYIAYPLQYLYSLLSHAEKSTYQFIESQINLHCLLHEAKTGTAAVRYRTTEAKRFQDHDGHQTPRDVTYSREHDEALLTAELRQKTSTIEELWADGLGSQIEDTRERVKAFLIAADGWDETLQGED